MAANDQSTAEAAFCAALTQDNENQRALLGLSYLLELQQKNGEAWSLFQQSLEITADPDPYIFAAWGTAKMRDAGYDMKSKVIPVLEKLADDQNTNGTLRAMANYQVADHYRTVGDSSRAAQHFQRVGFISDWSVIGPFDNVSASGFHKRFPPEHEYAPNQEYEGKNGAPVKWSRLAVTPRTGWINFRHYFVNLQSVYYANNFVCSPEK